MLLSELTQFDRDQFFKLLGVHLRDKRLKLKYSHEQFAALTGLFTAEEIIQIEYGVKNLSQEQFDCLRLQLNLDHEYLRQIGKLTQAQYLVDFFKVSNGV